MCLDMPLMKSHFFLLKEGADSRVLRGLQSEQLGRDQETRTEFERRKRWWWLWWCHEHSDDHHRIITQHTPCVPCRRLTNWSARLQSKSSAQASFMQTHTRATVGKLACHRNVLCVNISVHLYRFNTSEQTRITHYRYRYAHIHEIKVWWYFAIDYSFWNFNNTGAWFNYITLIKTTELC